MRITALRTIALAFLLSAQAQTVLADEVIKKLSSRYLGWKDLCARMELKDVGKSGNEREGESRMCVLFDGDGKRYGRVTVMSPVVARGMDLITKADLVGQSSDGQSQQWLYMPASKRVTQINANNTESAFMGSQFSYADLDLAYLDPDRLKRLDEVACDKDRCLRYTVSNDNATQITRILWVLPKTGAVRQIEILKQSKPYKRLQVKNETKHAAGWWIADHVVMHNEQTGERTESVWQDIRFNTGMTPADFDPKKIYGPGPSGRPQ